MKWHHTVDLWLKSFNQGVDRFLMVLQFHAPEAVPHAEWHRPIAYFSSLYYNSCGIRDGGLDLDKGGLGSKSASVMKITGRILHFLKKYRLAKPSS